MPTHHAPSPASPAATLADFEIAGVVTKKSNPFASQFGRITRNEMSRLLYDEDHSPDQINAKAQCALLILAFYSLV